MLFAVCVAHKVSDIVTLQHKQTIIKDYYFSHEINQNNVHWKNMRIRMMNEKLAKEAHVQLHLHSFIFENYVCML